MLECWNGEMNLDLDDTGKSVRILRDLPKTQIKYFSVFLSRCDLTSLPSQRVRFHVHRRYDSLACQRVVPHMIALRSSAGTLCVTRDAGPRVLSNINRLVDVVHVLIWPSGHTQCEALVCIQDIHPA